jgi:hypothetical protein
MMKSAWIITQDGTRQDTEVTDDPFLKHIDPELYDALEQWPERPELTPPVWPDQLQMF